MEQGSLTLAAQKMNLSQPAASRLLSQLEEEFGAPLFFRDSKTLTPSREAELLYPEATRVLASFEELPQIMSALKTDATMPLKVVGQMRCTLGLVVPAVAQLNKEYPDVPIDLDVHKRAELRRRTTWDRFDVGVFAMPLHIDFAEVILSLSATCYVILPKAHPLAARDGVTPDDLAGIDYVTVREALVGRTIVENTLLEAGYEIPVKHEVSNAFAAVSLVRDGLGFMIADRFTIDHAHFDDISMVPLTPAPVIEYAICVSRDMRVHPLRSRLIEILIERLKADRPNPSHAIS